jgi:hypothetical protein
VGHTEPRTGAARVDNPPPQVGAQRQFWVWDFAVMPPAPKQISATCRAVGDHGAFWVDDAAWNHTVNAADVATLDQRFNHQASPGAVDPTQGIGALDKTYFGDVPHVIDPDSTATILLTEFATFNGTSMDGYFNAFDQMPDAEAQKYGQHSNEKNLIYLNTAGSPVAGDYMQAVLAHEFSHLLQFGKDPDRSSWMGEMLAEVAMNVNGFHTDYGHVARHQEHPERVLESETYVDYGACYLFGTYMMERYGKTFVQRVNDSTAAPREAINAALQQSGQQGGYENFLADWAVANYTDSRDVAQAPYQYASLDPPAPATITVNAAATQAAGKLEPSGVAYASLQVPRATIVHFNGDPGLQGRLLSFKDGQMSVTPVAVGADFLTNGDNVLAIIATGKAPGQQFTVIANPNEAPLSPPVATSPPARA